jgi:fructose-6-phosphate aldolase 2
MKIVIDSANVDTIKKLIDYYPIDGVTTNPSIIVKEKRPFLPLLKEIRSIIGDERMLHVQVLSSTATEMVEEAINNREQLGGNYYTKIPVTREGIKAIKELKLKGIKVLATTIYTPMQAIVAAKAGANYVAPYVNRIENLSGNGIQVVEEIRTMFDQYNLSCKILAASFKNVRQVQGVCLAGAHAITAGGDIIESLLNHPSTQGDVEQFQEDWKSFYREE